jgi:hypothetical protein
MYTQLAQAPMRIARLSILPILSMVRESFPMLACSQPGTTLRLELFDRAEHVDEIQRFYSNRFRSVSGAG